MAVYSTELGRLCPRCEKAIDSCQCNDADRSSDVQGPIYIRRESKGRGGKPVTLINGLALETSALSTLAKKLRKRIGVGGSMVDGEILLQGAHRTAVQAYLSSAGFEVKVSGG